MHLQRSKVLRRQGNRRGRSISRHEQPKLAQLCYTLRDPSAAGRRNQRVPVLCRWQLHQKGQGNGGRLQRNLDHLSYGGRVTLRRCPFFMPVTHPVFLEDGLTKIEKTSKQTQDSVLHFIVFACLFFKNAGSAAPVKKQARKDKHAETLSTQGFSVLWRGRSPSRRVTGTPVIKLEKTSKLKRWYKNVSAYSGEREARAGRCLASGK